MMKNKFTSVLTALIVMFSAIPANAAILEDDNIYFGRNIYTIDFTGANTVDGVYKATTDEEKAIVKTWQPEGLSDSNIFSSFGAVNSSYTYQVIKDDKIRENNEVLKLSASASSAVKSVYTDITTEIASSDYYISDDGVLSLSFDFLANGSYMAMRTGRTIGEDVDGNIEFIKGEGQRLLKITPEAQLIMFGTTYGNTLQLPMYSDEEQTEYGHDNKWHNIELLMSANNQYKVYFDGEALNEGEWLDFVTTGASDSKRNCTFAPADGSAVPINFRGFTTLRIYNGFNVKSSTYYYDNFKYTVYDDVTAEYELPTIGFSEALPSVINLEEGDAYTLSLEAQTVCPDVINVYVDGVLSESFNGKSCEYVYTADAGMHTVTAEAVDAQGEISQSCSVTFIATEKIEIEGAFNDDEVLKKKLIFETVCADGLDRVEFYINGEKVKESTSDITEFDFSAYGSGSLFITAVVYDVNGKSKSFDYTAVVELSKNLLLWNESFDDYTDEGSSSIGQNINLNAKNGYYKPVVIDDEHGVSLALGVEVDSGSDTGAYANFVNSKGTSHVVFETEFYISDYPAEAEAARKEIHFDMIESGSVQNAMFKINHEEIYKGSTTLSYEKEKWYDLKIDFDIPNKTYSIYIDGETFLENIDLAEEKPAFASLNSIRCYGPGVADVPCFIAFDNSKISVVENHGIEAVLNKDGGEQILSDSKILKIKLSEGILSDSLSIDKVSLGGELGQIRISSVKYDEEQKCITLTILDSLLAGKSYSVQLSGDVISSSGNMLGSDLSKSFTVVNDAEVGIDYSNYSNGKLSLYVSGGAENEKDVCVVVTAWNGKEYLGMKVQEETLSSEVDILNIETDFPTETKTLQVYILDSLSSAKMLINDIYTVKN